MQRFVVEGGPGGDIGLADVDDRQEILSDQDEENLRFWTAVLRDRFLVDVTVGEPAAYGANLFVKVNNTGFNNWALSFAGYVNRQQSRIGCYLAVRRGQTREIRIFDELIVSFDELRDVIGNELEHWQQGGLRRIGFRRDSGLAFLSASEESEEFREAVLWMREHLNRLVSNLNPRLQRMLAAER